MKKLNEDTSTKWSVIEWLKDMGYDYKFGLDLAPKTRIAIEKSETEAEKWINSEIEKLEIKL